MADAAAGSGQKQRAPRRIGGIRHGGPSDFSNLRIKPRLGPGLIRRLAAEFDTVVQAERAVVPEFETRWLNAPATPARRPRHLADNMFGRDQSDRLLEGKAAFQRLRLLAGPGADLRLLWPCCEIGVGLGFGYRRHVAADADLPAQRLPVKK